MLKKKCLLVVNKFAGNYRATDEEIIKNSIGEEYDVTVLYVSCATDSVNRIEGYDLVVVCGGDGTLNRLINRDIARGTEVRYYPSGTLNEAADKRRGQARKTQKNDLRGGLRRRKIIYLRARGGHFHPFGIRGGFQKETAFQSARVYREGRQRI